MRPHGFMALAVLLAGCAGGDEARPADATAVRRQLIQRSEGNVAGTIVAVDEKSLELAPFGAASEPIRYALDDDVGVFSGGEPCGRAALQPGVPINVFFVREGDRSRAVCVQLLEPGIARALRQGR